MSNIEESIIDFMETVGYESQYIETNVSGRIHYGLHNSYTSDNNELEEYFRYIREMKLKRRCALQPEPKKDKFQFEMIIHKEVFR